MAEFKTIDKAVRAEGAVSRRLFLAYGSALASVPYLGLGELAQKAPSFSKDPFSLGVASGDPNSDSVVLWTRIAPEPLQPGGGMPPDPVDVHWEIASDEGLKNRVSSGIALATPQLGHSVHAVVEGLKADRWYWYRFRCGDAESPVGRCRTLPQSDTLPGELRFAFASCQNFEQGLFTAYDHMAKEDLDLVFHLGDYIYEYQGFDGKVRKHIGEETESLEDYRIRYSQYKQDPHLQAVHSHCPWFVTWDDHEFDNNCAGDISEEKGVDPAHYLWRRANAYQAYYEMMPLRPQTLPKGPHMHLYRKASFGRLAEFLILDTRQYRSDQPNGDGKSVLNEEALNPANTLLGEKQRDWLFRSLLQSEGTWNVLAQQVMMGIVDRSTEEGADPQYSMDQWPGYADERRRLLEFLDSRRVPNPVVLTGDIHANYVNELRFDDRQPELPVVAAEFVGSSISSGGDGRDQPADYDVFLSENPCIKFHNQQRGYVRCRVTPDSWVSDYLTADQVSTAGGVVSKRASFRVEKGRSEIEGI